MTPWPDIAFIQHQIMHIVNRKAADMNISTQEVSKYITHNFIQLQPQFPVHLYVVEGDTPDVMDTLISLTQWHPGPQHD